jgi:hypothetical protein
MDEYVCKRCGAWFQQWGGIYFPHCPTCYSSKVVRMTHYIKISEYREHEYMRIRLRRWDIRVQRLYEGGYITRAVYDAYHDLTSIYFFDWYHIQIPQWAASLHPHVAIGTPMPGMKRRYRNPPLQSIMPPRRVPRYYDEYVLLGVRFEPILPGE